MMKQNRRRFLARVGGAAAGAAAGVSLSAKARAGKRRPNFLIVLDDQERPYLHLPPLHLPNRERLKRHAVEFTHAYCTYPLCSPSRATVMTGLYPHQAGILTNVDFAAKNPSLPREIPNLARVFSQAGYKTAYFGKWHLSRRAHTVGNLHRYGFQFPHVSNQLIAAGSDPKVAENAAHWLEKSKDSSPWLAVFSPINPHDICFPFLERVYQEKEYPVTLPPNFSSRTAPDIQTVKKSVELSVVEKMLPKTEDEWLRYLKFYCLLIEEVDKHLGAALDALEASGQWEDTVVIFTSDHGEMGGSHGLAHKGPTMYEENMRIPLLISDPRQCRGLRKYHGLVSNLDLVPTLCSLAGVKWPTRLPGRSLAPALQDDEPEPRDFIFAEGSPRMDTAWRGLRTDEWKYFVYSTGEELLFNIKEDPLELENLAEDKNAGAELKELRARVQKWREETKDPLL